MVIYGCLSMKEKLGIEVLGLYQEVNLKWWKGQIGAAPIFSKKEDALDYVDGNEDRVFKLILKDEK